MPFNIQKVEIAKLVEPNNYAIDIAKKRNLCQTREA